MDWRDLAMGGEQGAVTHCGGRNQGLLLRFSEQRLLDKLNWV
jgi:hypothetical protein